MIIAVDGENLIQLLHLICKDVNEIFELFRQLLLDNKLLFKTLDVELQELLYLYVNNNFCDYLGVYLSIYVNLEVLKIKEYQKDQIIELNQLNSLYVVRF